MEAGLPDRVLALLHGAYDLHVHCAPDVIPRAQDLLELAADAQRAGLAGVGIKDHTTSTAGRVYALNRLYPTAPHFYSYLVLNPPVGGLNPHAVEAALHGGVDLICFPTYAARHQIRVRGTDGFVAAYPRPGADYQGIAILYDDGTIRPEVVEIVDLIAAHDAVLTTGHLSPAESLALLSLAHERGVRRLVVNHASERVPDMAIALQRQAAACGAFVEHCLLAIVSGHSADRTPVALADQIQQLGAERVILSSDLGQAANGPVIAALGQCLERLLQAGLTESQIRTMLVDNPRELLAGRRAG